MAACADSRLLRAAKLRPFHEFEFDANLSTFIPPPFPYEDCSWRGTAEWSRLIVEQSSKFFFRLSPHSASPASFSHRIDGFSPRSAEFFSTSGLH